MSGLSRSNSIDFVSSKHSSAESVAPSLSAGVLTILHLSDLHFGIEPGGVRQASALAQRKIILGALKDALVVVDGEWKPDVVVVSGDVGWRGKPGDYAQAKAWIEGMLATLGLGADRLVVSAGNHDFDRGRAIGRGYPVSKEQADEWLDPGYLDTMGEPFAAYREFRREMGLPPLRVGELENDLVGYRDVEWLRFVILNSAWFCLDNQDKDRLWIGRPQIDVLEAEGQLPRKENGSYDEGPVTVAVLHHPEDWLSPEEVRAYGRPATYKTLARRSHLILHGHVHAAPESPGRVVNGGAWSLVGGATYAGGDYRNHVNLIRIERGDRSARVRPIEYDPRSRVWRPHDEETFSLRSESGTPSPSPGSAKASVSDPARLRARLRDHVERYVNAKSRAVATAGPLPELVERGVVVHGIEERVEARGGSLRLSLGPEHVALSDVVSSVRPTFLLGDLGSGKSTAAGVYALGSMEKSDGVLSVLVPAKHLRGRPMSTVAELAEAVSAYIDGQVFDGVGEFDLPTLLRSGATVELVLDGIDEMKKAAAKTLLARAEELNGRHASLRVLATGRPVELQGVDYGQWQVAVVPPVNDDERLALLYNEARASGLDADAAKEDAERRRRWLRSHPELVAVATTPLFLRMLRPHLEGVATERTLGDLLYDVLLSRIGDWGDREGRSAGDEAFQQRYPDALAREGLVASVAAAVWESRRGGITKAHLRRVLEGTTADEALAAHASEFLLRGVLVEEGGRVQFPSQPLLECAVGVHVARGASVSDEEPTLASWRPYSFAAAVARRKGTVSDVRPRLKAVVDELLGADRAAATPAAAAVVAESQDDQLAVHYVEGLSRLPYRPLRLLAGSEASASVAVARSLALAGDAGFDWLYDEYLDPAYPLDGADDRVLTGVVPAWAASVEFEVTPSQRERLVRLVEPHLAAHSMQCHTVLPTVALLVPEAFEDGLRRTLYVDALSRRELAELATDRLREMAAGPERAVVVAALRAAASQGLSAPPRRVLDLLLELEDGRIVDPILAASLLRAGSAGRGGLSRVGMSGPDPFARWCALKQGGKHSAAAAVYVVGRGERRLSVVGPALLGGLHDGGRVEGAEEALDEVVGHAGDEGVWWLSRQFAQADRVDGAHSGYWRVLLRYIGTWEDGADVARVLCTVAPYAGEWLLPRYSEIRRSLRAVLERHGTAREALERATWNLSREVRAGSARVLLACFPESAFRALDIAIQSAGERSRNDEWLRFCLQLDLGAAMVDHVEAQLADLVGVPRTFALLLLHQNGRSLDQSQREDVVRGVFGDGFHLRGVTAESAAGSILKDPATFDFLLDALFGLDEGLHAEAARVLLESHGDRLTLDQQADCWIVLDRELSTWTVRRYEADLDPLLRGAAFRDALERAARRRAAEPGRDPLAWVYAQAQQEPGRWAELLWRAVARDSSTSDLEYIGPWLLGRGVRDAEVGAALGEAAVEYLGDPRFAVTSNDYFTAQAVQWLTVFADEFGEEVDEASLASALRRQAKDETEVALLTRLGSTPDGYAPRHPKPYLLAFQQPPAPPSALGPLGQVLRDGDGLHPEFAAHVAAALLREEPSDLESLSTATSAGGVFATLVAFCRGESVPPRWPVWAMSSEAFRTVGPETPTPVSEAFHRALAALSKDDAWRREYVEAIETGLETNRGKPWSGVRMKLYQSLLRAGSGLDGPLFAGITEELASRPYLLDRGLARVIVERLAEEAPPAEFADPLLRLGRALAATSASSREDATGPLQLIVALGLMRLLRERDPLETDLFVRGIVEVLVDLPTHWVHQGRAVISQTPPNPRFPARHVLTLVAPLLERTPEARVRDCIVRGAESDDPVTRSCCLVLGALSNGRAASYRTSPKRTV